MNSELECLAGAVYFESKGEPLSGQLAVANVIINRTKSGRFPTSICSVVKQPGQFSFVRGGRIPAVGANAQYRTATAIAKVALAMHGTVRRPRRCISTHAACRRAGAARASRRSATTSFFADRPGFRRSR